MFWTFETQFTFDWLDKMTENQNKLTANTSKESRFDVYTEAELKEKIENSVPDGTRKKVRWALNLLKDWQNETINDETRLHM